MTPTKLFTLAALASLAMAGSAVADDMPSAKAQTTYEATSNGGYDKSTKTTETDSAGTTMTHEATKKVDVDSKGNSTTSVDIKDTTDPKGLMNKTTTETKNKAVVKDGSMKVTHVKKVNGSTVEKTDDSGTTALPQ